MSKITTFYVSTEEYEATQYDPADLFAPFVQRWPDESGSQPKDMSFGYVDCHQGGKKERKHVQAGWWIVSKGKNAVDVLSNEDFHKAYRFARNRIEK